MLDVSVSECLIALAAIGAAVAVIVKALKPWNDLNEQVKEHDDRLEYGDKRMDTIESLVYAMARSMLQVQNHIIDGNHTNQLIESRDNLQDALTKGATK